MKKMSSFLKKLLNNNRFLKVLSVFMAIIVWLCITNIVNPTNEKTFTKIPVQINYENSVAEQNDLMMLLPDTALSTNVVVQGPRSNLQFMTEDKITAELNLGTVAAAGTYPLPIVITISDPEVNVKEVSPATITVEFVKKSSVTLPLTLRTTGTPQQDYEVTGANFETPNVTITGPEETVANIGSAFVEADVSGLSASTSMDLEIRLADTAGNEIPQKYLTLDTTQTKVDIQISKAKIVPVEVTVTNSNQCIENAYRTVSYSRDSVKIYGDEQLLSIVEKISLGSIDTATIKEDSYSVELNLPEVSDITYEDSSPITVNISFADMQTKRLTYTAEELQGFKIANAENQTVTITSSSLSITVRANTATIDEINKESFIPTVDLSQRNEKGQYRVYFYNSSDLNAGVIGEYYVSVRKE